MGEEGEENMIHRRNDVAGIDDFIAELHSPRRAFDKPGAPCRVRWVLTHLIGDIHQPHHAADHNDRGGNMIQVRLPWGRKANLHGAWDNDFVEHALGGKNEKRVAHELLLKFDSRKADWQTGTIQAWMDESNQLAKTVAYGKIAGFTCDADLKRKRIFLDQNYADEATTIVEEQLAKASPRSQS